MKKFIRSSFVQILVWYKKCFEGGRWTYCFGLIELHYYACYSLSDDSIGCCFSRRTRYGLLNVIDEVSKLKNTYPFVMCQISNATCERLASFFYCSVGHCFRDRRDLGFYEHRFRRTSITSVSPSCRVFTSVSTCSSLWIFDWTSCSMYSSWPYKANCFHCLWWWLTL